MDKRILWFGDIGRRNGFSVISEAVIPLLAKDYKITVLAPPEEQIIDPFYCENVDVVHVGDPCTDMNYENFIKMVPEAPVEQLRMKYALLQAGFLCDMNKINCLVFLGGSFVIEWFMRLINQRRTCIPSKIVIWTTFESIPSHESVFNLLKADVVLTTNPVSSDKLAEYSKLTDNKGVVDWVGHGVSPEFFSLDKKSVLKKLNKVSHEFYLCSKKIKEDDTIILNANNFLPRKRLDITMKLYARLFDSIQTKKPKLWLHTNTRHPMFDELVNRYKDYFDSGYVIVTHNDVTKERLNWIYNACDYGLQTSTGEGWSLTNCEHEATGGTQIVPDFLATGFNFEYTGVLLPITETTEKDELGNDTTVGLVDPDDDETLNVLKNCVVTKLRKDKQEKYTWELASTRIKEHLL